jgi:hypothetical protein
MRDTHKNDVIVFPAKTPKRREKILTANSELRINIYDDEWKILPNKAKGHTLKVGWVHSSEMLEEHKELILDVLAFYVEKRSANTATGIIHNTQFMFEQNGIPSLSELKSYWSGFKTNQKKGHNSFFLALKNLGYKEYAEYHEFTSNNLDKETTNQLDPVKGALTDTEFDSLANEINKELRKVDWNAEYDLDFYKSQKFTAIVKQVSNKLMISIVRRPVQLSVLKWCDLIEAGRSFYDKEIDRNNEIRTIGEICLQVRVFKAKEKANMLTKRGSPERYPLVLHENFSLELMLYKSLYFKGLKLLVKSSGFKTYDNELLKSMDYMPIFPCTEFFDTTFDSIKSLNHLFTEDSMYLHAPEGLITRGLASLKPISDRVQECSVTSNRIRHTVLTRGAQDGLNSAQLAKLTGVTEPAARHYIDLDYSSRRMIDSKYIGNNFLRKAFNTPITDVTKNGEYIYDQDFNAVGGINDKITCNSCSTRLGKPLGCYGCHNFKPILEADHTIVLVAAEQKRDANKKSLISPLQIRSIEKIEKQIALIKLTIEICNDILSRRTAIDA